MSRVFETKEITKLLDALIGQTDAVGETHEDGRRLDNLKTLIDVTNWCLDGLQFAMASGYGRPEYSMAEISYTAQCALDEYGRWIADVLDEQIADRKDEPTISKMEQVDKDINVRSKPNDCKYAVNPSGDVWECGCCLEIFCEHQIYDRNPDGTLNIVKCGFKPKTEPQTCSFSDCDNFKNPDYERCIECKRKQIKLKTEQTEREGE